jgi:hypothetical protein
MYNGDVYMSMRDRTYVQREERTVQEVEQEILRLLREIKDLLIPISDEYRDAYEQREAIRADLAGVVNTPARVRMYELMNGARTQVEIAEQAGVTQGAVSRFISTAVESNLLEMVRVGAAERPVRMYDVESGRRLRGKET